MCIYYGCTYPIMFNYDSSANTNDGSCIPVIEGCIDELALNYDTPISNPYLDANTDDGTCYFVNGCMVDTMYNYNPLADNEDGSCIPFIDVVLLRACLIMIH
ncbi:MAG: hypothetical protein CM15mP23_18500 [Cryomorphaceae bacterium]|nr:MAG: hypothetical protein CM15mP23_18500 [Cryomorphaceae bacterium]